MLQIKEIVMTEDFIWGGINIRKFCRFFIRNIWMIIAVMIITYLGLSLVDQHTYTPRYASAAVAAVYPSSSDYRYHTIETISNLSSKTEDMNSVFNSDLFRSGLHNYDPSLQDCMIKSSHVAYTDLLVLRAISGSRENALKGIQAALDFYSRFSGDITGASEIKVVFGPKAPYQESGGSKIQKYRAGLCLFSGLVMAGILLFIYFVRKTYKTERCIRRCYKDIRFFSLPFTKSGSEHKKGIRSKNNSREPVQKLALQIKQVLHKCNKKTLLVTSFADKEGGTAIISELARALAEQELKVHCMQCRPDDIDEDIPYSIDDVKRELFNCQEYADVVLVNGAACYPSCDVQIWHEAVDASIALCRQDDADFFKVDKMLSDLQKGNTYFAGCVLYGF